jgi:broad specificity phosphatase PhoE
VTRLLLVRHPQTSWNVDGRFQGQSDVPLSAEGERQAAGLVSLLVDRKLDAIYSSDLQRARLAAELIADATRAPLVLDPRLREINQGQWEGKLGSEVRASHPELLLQRREDPMAFVPPGGEPFRDVRQRVLAAICDIATRHAGGTVLVVSHGLALAIVRAAYQGHPITDVWQLIPVNAEIIEVSA